MSIGFFFLFLWIHPNPCTSIFKEALFVVAKTGTKIISIKSEWINSVIFIECDTR